MGVALREVSLWEGTPRFGRDGTSGPSPRAGSVASFRLSEGSVYGRYRRIVVLRGHSPVGAVAMSGTEAADGPADLTAQPAGLILSEETVSGVAGPDRRSGRLGGRPASLADPSKTGP